MDDPWRPETRTACREKPAQCDDLDSHRCPLPGPPPCELEGALVGLRAGIQKNTLMRMNAPRAAANSRLNGLIEIEVWINPAPKRR
jgi:hypothetical protein